MEKRLYHICLWGSEDSRDCSIMLTEEEANILCRLEDELHPLKGYVPHIYVVDVEKSEEEARKLEEKKAAERKANANRKPFGHQLFALFDCKRRKHKINRNDRLKEKKYG